jgi:hypothetical protein
MVEEPKKDDAKVGRALVFLGIAGLFQMAAGAFVLCLMYGVFPGGIPRRALESLPVTAMEAIA